MESSGLDLSLLLERRNDALLGPAGQGGEFTERAEFSVSLHAEGLKGVWDDHSLFLIVGERNSFEDLKFAESIGTSGFLVGEHATKGLPENTTGGFPVFGSTTGVRVNAFIHCVQSNDLVSLQGTRLEDLLAANDSDVLAGQKFLRNNAGKTALKVTFSVND